MKAAQIKAYGDASVIQIAEVARPSAGDGQALIEVHASSINPFDAKLRSGMFKDMIPLTLPITLGGDIAGIVTETGPGVSNIKAGDRVYGQAQVAGGNSGAFAEYAVTAANQVARAPQNIDFAQAAALPLVGVSALQAITELLKLQPGQKLFVHGGAGGIGSIAIQIAKHIGAYVAATATGEGVSYVKQLGADEVIDYKAQDFAQQLNDYDAAFDTVGDDIVKILHILKRGGAAVSMLVQADEAVAQKLGVTATMLSTVVTSSRLDRLRDLVENDVVTPHVDEAFPLKDTQQAFEAYESGRTRGKVVIEIK